MTVQRDFLGSLMHLILLNKRMGIIPTCINICQSVTYYYNSYCTEKADHSERWYRNEWLDAF